ncbi:MAG: hypothetical protein JXA04_08495 [Gammaproteobacteria bacterium]|nr:hypothetical protein [Gammaproteobacteria bacterium]
MPRKTHLLPLVFLAFMLGGNSLAESKRVHVYQLPQQTWDVRPGDTLSGISAALLPGSRADQRELMQSILEINPDAFINRNPNRLRAYVRLVLPGEVETYSVSAEDSTTHVQQFNWGSIQRREQ